MTTATQGLVNTMRKQTLPHTSSFPLLGNSYAEDQIMHTFLDNFHQSGKYSAQLASHNAELRREEMYPDQRCLNISSLQTEYLNLDNSNLGSSKHNEKANSAKTKCTYCELSNHSVETCFKKIRKEKEKSRSTGTSSNKNSDCSARKCFRCRSEDHIIAKCPKPPKDSEKDASLKNLRKKVIVHATTSMMTTTLKYTHL